MKTNHQRQFKDTRSSRAVFSRYLFCVGRILQLADKTIGASSTSGDYHGASSLLASLFDMTALRPTTATRQGLRLVTGRRAQARSTRAVVAVLSRGMGRLGHTKCPILAAASLRPEVSSSSRFAPSRLSL